MFEIPPYPIVSNPQMIDYLSHVFDSIQKKYNSSGRVVVVPTFMLSPSTSTTTSSTPEKSRMADLDEDEEDSRRLQRAPTRKSSISPQQGCRCGICGKMFSRQWLLQGHLRTHTGEKPFKCEICEKHFADKSNLRAHIQTHSGDKPHKCQRCGKRFALKSYLSKHEESKCLRKVVYSWKRSNNL